MTRIPFAAVALAALTALSACGGTAPAASSPAASGAGSPNPAASTAAKPAASGSANAKPAASASAKPAASPKVFTAGAAPAQANASCTGQTRKITIGVSVAPPNVIHTVPFVARGLGLFAKHCVEADIVQFEGGLSQTALTAVAKGSAIGPLNEIAIGAGLPGHQVWQMAPHMPQFYVVGPDIKTAADLKGKKMSASGGGVGSFNWLMGREVLKTAGLTVNDAQFINAPTAGRLPGLIAGQVDGVALHPEDVYLAQKQKPGVHTLVKLNDLLPNYAFNSYGASNDFIAKDPALLRDTIASLIEASRAIYQQKDKVIPIIVQATEKPQDAVEYAYDQETKNCNWSVNTGFEQARTEWTADWAVQNGDVQAAKKPSYDQIVDSKLANEALADAGGPTTIGSCKA